MAWQELKNAWNILAECRWTGKATIAEVLKCCLDAVLSQKV